MTAVGLFAASVFALGVAAGWTMREDRDMNRRLAREMEARNRKGAHAR